MTACDCVCPADVAVGTILWGQLLRTGYSTGQVILLGSLVIAGLIDVALTLLTIILPAVEIAYGVAIYSVVLVCEAVVIINSFIAIRQYAGTEVDSMNGNLPFLIVSAISTMSAFAMSMWSLRRARKAARVRGASAQAVHPLLVAHSDPSKVAMGPDDEHSFSSSPV